MTHLITLAHRVSGIRARYSSIHSALFTFSFARLKTRLSNRSESVSCGFQRDLAKLKEELDEVNTIIKGATELEPRTTFSREFTAELEAYIQALSNSISSLSEICSHQCQSDMGNRPYTETQARTDRTTYDESIQHYRWLGERLNLMVKKL